MSGALDKGDLDRVRTSSYELVGICDDGLDMLYQPVNCGASGIVKQNDLVEFSAACRIKDYVADKRQRVLRCRTQTPFCLPIRSSWSSGGTSGAAERRPARNHGTSEVPTSAPSAPRTIWSERRYVLEGP